MIIVAANGVFTKRGGCIPDLVPRDVALVGTGNWLVLHKASCSSAVYRACLIRIAGAFMRDTWLDTLRATCLLGLRHTSMHVPGPVRGPVGRRSQLVDCAVTVCERCVTVQLLRY